MERSLSVKAFTLMEIMVVVIIVGIIAGFAIPNFSKSIDQSHYQDAVIQLSAIRSANQVYYARTATFWPPTDNNNVSAINTALSLNIIENGLTYECDKGLTSSQFTCTAIPTGGAYTVTVDQNPLSSPGNPSCSGSCP